MSLAVTTPTLPRRRRRIGPTWPCWSPASGSSWCSSTPRSCSSPSAPSRRRSPTSARTRCRGSCPATRWCSPPCSCRRAGSPIDGAASGCSSAGSLVFTIASALCGLAPSAGLLIAGRLVQAIGAAALTPTSLALVLRATPRERIPIAVAIWGSMSAVAAAFGPTIGGLLVDTVGWRWVFFVNLPVCVVALIAGRRVLAESREADPGPFPDLVGSACSPSASAPSRWPSSRATCGGGSTPAPSAPSSSGSCSASSSCCAPGRRRRRRSTSPCSASRASAGATWRRPCSDCRSPRCSSPTSCSSRTCGAGASSRPASPWPPGRSWCSCSPAASDASPPASAPAR